MASDALIETDFVLLMSQMSFPVGNSPKCVKLVYKHLHPATASSVGHVLHCSVTETPLSPSLYLKKTGFVFRLRGI